MSIIHDDPMRGMHDLESSLNRFFDGTLTPAWSESGFGSFPRMNVFENDEALRLELESAGVEKDEIDIYMANGHLTLSGERRIPEGDAIDYHRVERWYGHFSRSFQLPPTVDANRISAELRNGVLIVTLPKTEQARPKQIDVQVH